MLRTLMPPVWLSRSIRFRWAYQLRTRRAFTAPAIPISGAVGACLDSVPETLTRSWNRRSSCSRPFRAHMSPPWATGWP